MQRHTMIIIFVCLSFFICASDVSLISVALPSIGQDLQLDPVSLSLVIATSTLVYAGFLILGGRLSDMFGQGRCCIFGMAIYAVASVFIVTTSDIGFLVAARAVQGFALAVVSPAGFSLLNTALPDGPIRHRGYGAFAAANGLSMIVGFVAGGLVTTWLGWRAAFLLNIPFVVVGIFLALRYVPMGALAVGKRKLDLIGAVLVTSGTALLVWGFSALGHDAVHTIRAFEAICGGLVVFVLFFFVEGLVEAPLVPPALFRSRNVVGGVLITICLFVAAAGVFMLPNLYMQHVLGYSAAQSGLGMLPQSLSAFAAGQFVTFALPRFALRQSTFWGLAVFLAGLGAFVAASLLFPFAGYAVNILVGLSLCGFASVFTVMILMAIGTQTVEHSAQGLASAVMMAAQQVGMAFGISLSLGVVGSAAAAGVPQSTAIAYAFLASAGVVVLGVLLLPLIVRAPKSAAAVAHA